MKEEGAHMKTRDVEPEGKNDARAAFDTLKLRCRRHTNSDTTLSGMSDLSAAARAKAVVFCVRTPWSSKKENSNSFLP